MTHPPPPRRFAFRLALTFSIIYLLHPLWASFAPLDQDDLETSPRNSRFVDKIGVELDAKLTIALTKLTERLDASSRGSFDVKMAKFRDKENVFQTRFWLQSRLVLDSYLGLEEKVRSHKDKLDLTLNEDEDAALPGQTGQGPEELIRRLYFDVQPLGDDELAALKLEFGFIGELAALRSHELAGDPRLEDASRSITSESVAFALRLAAFSLFVMGLSLAGFALLAIFIVLGATRRISPRFSRASFSPHLLWETFSIFLFLMIIAHQLVSWLEWPPLLSTLTINILAPLIGCYPVAHGARFSDLKTAIGLTRGAGAAKEVLLGPVAYTAAIPLIAIATLILSIIIQITGTDVSRGMHPIVHQFAGEETPWVSIVLTLFIAVVAAPVIEELMFRGYLYSALRARFGAPASILLSAVFFAGIHPQGWIGLPLLTVVGVALATLREWRGSLLAPMAAHACVNGVTLTMLLILT